MNKDFYNLNHETTDNQDPLLSQESFERLLYVQKVVEQVTEVRPTLRRLVNDLVNEDALTILIERLIQQMA